MTRAIHYLLSSKPKTCVGQVVESGDEKKHWGPVVDWDSISTEPGLTYLTFSFSQKGKKWKKEEASKEPPLNLHYLDSHSPGGPGRPFSWRSERRRMVHGGPPGGLQAVEGPGLSGLRRRLVLDRCFTWRTCGPGWAGRVCKRSMLPSCYLKEISMRSSCLSCRSSELHLLPSAAAAMAGSFSAEAMRGTRASKAHSVWHILGDVLATLLPASRGIFDVSQEAVGMGKHKQEQLLVKHTHTHTHPNYLCVCVCLAKQTLKTTHICSRCPGGSIEPPVRADTSPTGTRSSFSPTAEDLPQFTSS